MLQLNVINNINLLYWDIQTRANDILYALL